MVKSSQATSSQVKPVGQANVVEGGGDDTCKRMMTRKRLLNRIKMTMTMMSNELKKDWDESEGLRRVQGSYIPLSCHVEHSPGVS